VDRLREEWSQVNRSFTERHSRWAKCRDAWRNLHTSCRGFGEWLDEAEAFMADWKSAEDECGGADHYPLPEARAKQKELEKQVNTKYYLKFTSLLGKEKKIIGYFSQIIQKQLFWL